MSKWYKSALVKGILIFLSVLSAITALLSLVIISTYSVKCKRKSGIKSRQSIQIPKNLRIRCAGLRWMFRSDFL